MVYNKKLGISFFNITKFILVSELHQITDRILVDIKYINQAIQHPKTKSVKIHLKYKYCIILYYFYSFFINLQLSSKYSNYTFTILLIYYELSIYI